MRSTFSGLNTLVRGIYAQQLSLDTTGHNISNASTEGYSRQRVNLATTLPEVVYGGSGALQVGTGVSIESVTRVRDTFMDQQMWKESSTLGYAQSAQTMWGKIEGIFRDDTETGVGMQTVLNNFWQSWQTLVTNASNDSARTAARQRAQELVDAVQHARKQLSDIVTDVNDTLTTRVAQINQMSSEIFALNKQISNIEVGGRDHANDLRDRRDLLVDRLAKLANVRCFEDKNHNYVIQISDVTIADGNSTTPLALASAPDADYGFEVKRVVVAGSNPTQYVRFANGEMHALQEANSTLVKGYLDELTTMSQYLLREFNGVHRAGYGSDNSTGTNFFGNAATDYTVPPAVPPVMTKSQWLDAFKVNPVLFNADGLAKVAAKTAEVKEVAQSNAAGGKATVTGAYTPPAGDTTYKNYQIRVTGVAAGVVGSIEYSINGGAWVAMAAPFTSAAGTAPFYGMTLAFANDPDTALGDTYSFSVPQANASGDNATNLANAIKMPTSPGSTLSGSSLDDYYESMIADLGIAAQNKERLADNQQTLVDQITNWRDSVAGVNIDEEMANMIKFQKGYNASARVITTIDEMLDKLINGTGIVGR